MKKNLRSIVSLIGVGLVAQYALANSVTENPTPSIQEAEWTLHSLGLNDAEHTSANGVQTSHADYLNEVGQVAGYSIRYNGGGQSAWVYDGNETKRIGLIDSAHTSLEGDQFSEVSALSETGQVAGISKRVSGDSAGFFYTTAWIYNGKETLPIGLDDSSHTNDTGEQWSEADFINDAGHVVGRSVKFNGNDMLGPSTWFYDGNVTKPVGLYGKEYAAADGTQRIEPLDLNQAGQVLGVANTYDEGDWNSQIVWLYDGDQSFRLGLTDAEHTRTDGFQSSSSWGNYSSLNNAGHAVGTSSRYGGRYYLGLSTWYYDGSQTHRIGLTGDEYMRTDGYQVSRPATGINEAGQVAGHSDRFDGDDSIGQAAWLYNGSETIRLGFWDDQHTAYNGEQLSEVLYLNESGQALGFSNKYEKNGILGRSSWLFDGKNIRELGLSGAEYTNIYKLNKLGQVLGDSTLDGSKVRWLYDSNTDKYHIIDNPPSSYYRLGDDGRVLGNYRNPSNYFISYAVSYTIDESYRVLNEMVSEGDLTNFGWTHLSSAEATKSSGHIVGEAVTTKDSFNAFLMSPKTGTGGNSAPTISIINPTENSPLLEGASVTFVVDAADSDGSITKVEYYAFGDQLFATATEAPFSITLDNAPYGTFDITAVAYDNDGNSTTSDVVTLTVNANDGGNIPPSITITSPSDNSELIEGAPVTFTVDASDADGSVTKVEYYAFGDQLFGTVTEAPFTLNVDRAPYGTFDITAVVYDDKGASTVSPAIVVKVVEPTIIVD